MGCAFTWARTRDLSVNSRALCQLSHGGTLLRHGSERVAHAGRCASGCQKVLPGLEPGLVDSKSTVITITLQNRALFKKGGHSGARTHDPGLIRPMLYHLSYTTIRYASRGSNSGPPACEAGVITN